MKISLRCKTKDKESKEVLWVVQKQVSKDLVPARLWYCHPR